MVYSNFVKDKASTLVLFGATGDLSRKKIIPALFELYLKEMLPKKWRALFFLRRSWTRKEFEDFILQSIGKSENARGFLKLLALFRGELEEKASFERLKKFLWEENKDASEKVFYLSIPPSYYTKVLESLRDAKLVSPKDKILIEKPFGRSRKEAKELKNLLAKFTSERQVFFVDHYLAKDAIKEIRSAALHPSHKIKKIEARVIEESLVGERGAYYDATGAFRDVGQNHLLQMIATGLSHLHKKEAVHDRRHAALQAIKFEKVEIIRGQYHGYRDEKGVAKESNTETYFKIRLQIQRENQDIELVLEAGKGFGGSKSEALIHFDNAQILRFDFNKSADGSLSPYAKILTTAFGHGRSVFVSANEIMEQWKIAERILASLQSAPLEMYDKGTAHKPDLFE